MEIVDLTAADTHVLENGQVLTRRELIVIELLVRRKGDAFIRGAIDRTQDQLLAVTAEIRRKLGANVGETIRDAAGRRNVPRIEV